MSSPDLASSSASTHVAMQMANPKAGAGIASSGGGNIDTTFQSANINDFGCKGDLSSMMPFGEGVAGKNVFEWVDNSTFAPFKFSSEPALAPLQSEISNANLSHTSLATHSNLNIQGNTGFLSQGGGAQH